MTKSKKAVVAMAAILANFVAPHLASAAKPGSTEAGTGTPPPLVAVERS